MQATQSNIALQSDPEQTNMHCKFLPAAFIKKSHMANRGYQ